MYVAVIVADLYIPAANSLKAKRKVLHSVRDRIHAHHRVSIAEIENHELWQRATLGIASVHGRNSEAQKAIARLLRALDEVPEASLTRCESDVWS